MFFAFLNILTLSIMIGISNSNFALSSSLTLFSPNQNIHKAQVSVNIMRSFAKIHDNI